MRVILTLLLMCVFLIASAQKRKTQKVHWNQWYDSAAFFNGPEPLIKGFGERSDTLSILHGGKTIFEFDQRYYIVNCLADYYFWFTRKYAYLFRKDVKIYEDLYYDGQGLEMASFVKKNYKGKKLPVKFRLPYAPEAHSTSPQPYDPDLSRAAPPTVQRFHKN